MKKLVIICLHEELDWDHEKYIIYFKCLYHNIHFIDISLYTVFFKWQILQYLSLYLAANVGSSLLCHTPLDTYF